MIIQCPNCSTGFNLPDKHITTKGAKLRCSRCSFVFRVRRAAPDQEIEFFYKPEDEAANLELEAMDYGEVDDVSEGGLDADDSHAIELGADFEALLNSASTPHEREATPPAESTPDVKLSSENTHIGFPGINAEDSPVSPNLSGYGFGSSSSSASEDPFPLAGGSIKNLKSKIKIEVPKPGAKLGGGLSGSSVTEEPPSPEASPTAGIDLFGDEMGPSDLDEHDPFSGAFEDALDSQSFVEDVAASAHAPVVPPEDDLILKPGQPLAPQAAEPQHVAAAQPLAVTPQPASPSPSPDILQGSSGGAFVDAGDMVDPSFGSEGPAFDPQQGVVNAAPLVTAPTSHSARPAAQPVKAAQPVAATTPARKKEPAAEIEDSWPTQADAIAAHRIGGGGLQKFANLVLIVLIVVVGFLGIVAALNKGMLDFRQFGSMIEVAFGDGQYKPRAEWVPREKVQPKAAMEAPLRTESVWAEVVPFGKKQRVLVVRGLLRNFDQQDYLDVSLRGIVLNGKEKIISEKVVPLGVLISNAQLQEASVLDDLNALMPQSAPPLKVASSEPFTIIFDTIPAEVEEGGPIFFRVDVSRRTGRDTVSAP